MSGVVTATAALQNSPVTMSLYTVRLCMWQEQRHDGFLTAFSQHAQYRFDYALSLDPATGLPTVDPSTGQPFGLAHQNPANKVVAILWHQGARRAALRPCAPRPRASALIY